jgi:hypothetical protein
MGLLKRERLPRHFGLFAGGRTGGATLMNIDRDA